jgi:transposase
MYIRTTQRQNRDGSIVRYLQLAESVWDPEKQRSQTRIVYNLGREEDLDVEAMRRLAKSVLRVACPDDLACLEAEAGALGQPIRIDWAKDYGGLYLLRALWDRLGLGKEVLRGASDRPTAPLLAEAAFLLVANRALAPESKLGLYERWLEEVFWPGAEDVELHHLYLALDQLAEEKERIEEAVFFRVADLLSLDVDLLFYDTTSVHFEIETEDEGPKGLRKWGHSKDHRADAPQVVVGLAVTRDGLPVKSWVFPGNTADVSTVETVKKDLAGWRLNRVVYVADGGCLSEDNLQTLARGGSGYIVGVPLRKSKEAAEVLARPGRFRSVADNLQVKEVQVPSETEAPVATRRRRYIVCFNPKEAERQRVQRAEILRVLEAELEALNDRSEAHPRAACTLLSSRRFGPYLKQLKSGRLRIDQARVRREEKLDGKWLLTTNDATLSPEDVALGYKQLLRVEESFRRLKHGIDIRPMHHRVEDRIRGHVFACILALLLERVAERDTGQPWTQIRQHVSRLKMVAYRGSGGRVVQTTELTQEQRKVLKTLEIQPPKMVHQAG